MWERGNLEKVKTHVPSYEDFEEESLESRDKRWASGNKPVSAGLGGRPEMQGSGDQALGFCS